MKSTAAMFNSQMASATLRDVDPKTQTRRVVARLLGFGEITEFQRSDTAGYVWTFRDRHMRWHDISHERLMECCPYGGVGDQLWGREAWRTCASLDHLSPRLLRPGAPVQYEAGGSNVHGHPKLTDMGRLRPGMFMPRWMSRITLEITGVRVERLQDISYRDCLAEGIAEVTFRPGDGYPLSLGYMVGPDDGKGLLKVTPQEPYRDLWEQINDQGSWNRNPYVWVIQFKRVTS